MAGENMVNLLDASLMGTARPEYLSWNRDNVNIDDTTRPDKKSSSETTKAPRKRKAKNIDVGGDGDNQDDDDMIPKQLQGKKPKTTRKNPNQNDITQPYVTVLVCELLDKLTRAQLDTILELLDLPKATENAAKQLEISLNVQQALVFDIEIQKALYQSQSRKRETMGKDDDYINETKTGDFQPFRFNKSA